MIYMASPYSHQNHLVRQRRFEEACRAAAALLKAGVSVFAPVVHSHSIAKYGMPTSWDYWSRLDREYLALCDVMAVLTIHGWQQSVGVQAEIELAEQLGIPVVYVAPADLEMEDDPPALGELKRKAHKAAGADRDGDE